MVAIFGKFNECTSQLTECLWYLDPENKTKFFPLDTIYELPFSPMHFAVNENNVDAISFYLEKLTAVNFSTKIQDFRLQENEKETLPCT